MRRAEFQAFHAGRGHEDGVELPVEQLAQAGVDIAPQGDDAEIRAQGLSLCLATQSAGAHGGSGGQGVMRGVTGG